MCHHVHVHAPLSAEVRKAAKKPSGIMILVYTSVVLAAIAVLALSGAPRQSEQVAAATVPVAAR